MKIPVTDKSTENGWVFVRGVYGPKTIEYLLKNINKSIANVNKSLRSLYE